MTKQTVKTVAVLGDSLSDLGQKWTSTSGRMGRLVREMRVNETGRFSDGRNWVDYLWQWATGEDLLVTDASTAIAKSSAHFSWPAAYENSLRDLWQGHSFMWTAMCNYAQGGAVADPLSATKSSLAHEQSLTCLHDQLQLLSKDSQTHPLKDDTLFLVWFGLNDLVTCRRSPDQMSSVVAVMQTRIQEFVRAQGRPFYWRFLSLPMPSGSARYFGRTDEEVASLDEGARAFNARLAPMAAELEHLLSHGGGAHGSAKRCSVIDVASVLGSAMQGSPRAQPRGVRVRYGLENRRISPPAELDDEPGFTSDEGHPNEAGYYLVAKTVVENIGGEFRFGYIGRTISDYCPSTSEAL